MHGAIHNELLLQFSTYDEGSTEFIRGWPSTFRQIIIINCESISPRKPHPKLLSLAILLVGQRVKNYTTIGTALGWVPRTGMMRAQLIFISVFRYILVGVIRLTDDRQKERVMFVEY
jgi:hypothetical protein